MKLSFLMLSVLFVAGCTSVPFGNGCTGSSCSTELSDQNSCQTPACSLTGINSCWGIGCLCTDQWKTKCAAKSIANSHLPKHSCSDYKAGFRQAFVDVAMGGSGQTPAIAPRKYWKYCDRTTAGHATAQVWFDGYQAGSQIALTYQDRFLDIAISQNCGYSQLPRYSVEAGY